PMKDAECCAGATRLNPPPSARYLHRVWYPSCRSLSPDSRTSYFPFRQFLTTTRALCRSGDRWQPERKARPRARKVRRLRDLNRERRGGAPPADAVTGLLVSRAGALGDARGKANADNQRRQDERHCHHLQVGKAVGGKQRKIIHDTLPKDVPSH